MMKLEFDLQCPNCRRKFRQRIERMQPGMSRLCPYCAITIKFTSSDGRKAHKAIAALRRTMERTFRTSAFRL